MWLATVRTPKGTLELFSPTNHRLLAIASAKLDAARIHDVDFMDTQVIEIREVQDARGC